MTTHNRWMVGALALSLIAVVALGVYVVLLQVRLSGQISDVDTKLSTRVETVREDLGVQIENVELRSRLASQFDREFVSGELDTLSRSLAQRANVLSSQLDTLDATLSREMSQTSVWLRGNVQGVRDRLNEVQTELTGADTALQERVVEQETELRGALAALTADRARISADLDDLAMDISALVSETSRALLDVSTLYDAVRGSVVEVAVNGEALGSGFVTEIDSREFVVTAWHVVRRPGEVTVRLSDGRSIAAGVVISDVAEDVALLELEEPSSVPPVVLADPETLSVGQPVLVVGSDPSGEVTAGIIGALGRETEDFPRNFFPSWHHPTDLVQIEASPMEGNSGSPVFNVRGEVVGAISFGIELGDDSGLNFAVSAALLQTLADTMVADTSSTPTAS